MNPTPEPEPAALQPGICDACNNTSEELTLVFGTQWANCPACKTKAEQARVITDGRHTDSMAAIGRADAPTLRLAAKCCDTAVSDALAEVRPASGYRTRGSFCRRRLNTILADQGKRHTLRL